MTEQTNNLTKLFADCWKDADLKARFQSNPSEVLAEYGMDVPEGVTVNVVENNDTTVHITLPASPDNHEELSDKELANAAGAGVFGPGITFVCEPF
ncbi:MAG: NHLP leader peptide family natural product precursor [Planctomycetes bacterium]|nr:NHLP leader peptide family natural product precursor [Planctomycetota bacterium]